MRIRPRTPLATVAAVLALALMGGCILPSKGLDLAHLREWLEVSPLVESVVESTEPHEREGEPDRQVFTVDLDDGVSAADLSGLLDDLNSEMNGNFPSFEGGVVRFAVQPGHNEMSLETHAESWKGQFAAAAALWLQLPEHFEVFTVELPYVHRDGWSIERVTTVDLGDVPWSEASTALRTLTSVGAFGPAEEPGNSSTWVTTAPHSPWWGGTRRSAIGYEVDGGGPSEALLAAVDSLDALQREGAVSFDFVGGPWRADGATLGVLAVVPADAGMSNDAGPEEISSSQAWQSTTRIVDVISAHRTPFSLALKVGDASAPTFATLDSESCNVTATPLSQQLTDYWRSTGGAC